MSNPTYSADPRDSQPRSARRAYVVTNGVTLFAQALVGLKSGFLNFWLGTDAGFSAPGLALEEKTGDTSVSPNVRLRVVHGETLVGVSVTGAAAANVGEPVYAADGNIDTGLTLTDPTGAKAIGWLSDYRGAGDMDVTMFTPEEYAALE